MLWSPKRAQDASAAILLSSGKLSLANKAIEIVYLLAAYIYLTLLGPHRPSSSATTHSRGGSVSDVLQLLLITIRAVYNKEFTAGCGQEFESSSISRC